MQARRALCRQNIAQQTPGYTEFGGLIEWRATRMDRRDSLDNAKSGASRWRVGRSGLQNSKQDVRLRLLF
jgi:hypothetical protein